ncbi:MAG: 5-deoxy-glucuronate isomerase [Acidobacteria bacterium]|nr:MAG: 5-deoxy-glucuronate isomerase [Acidobacteriota bacterium]
MSCGRIRKPLSEGVTPLLSEELKNLRVSALLLPAGGTFQLVTGEREHALVLVRGDCSIRVGNGMEMPFGPRPNPFEHRPFGLLAGREDTVSLTARCESIIGIGTAPAAKRKASTLVNPDTIGVGYRGVGNWARQVRFVCWSDNTEGNMLLAGETVTPSGNWSTIPPHRHQRDIPGEEVPYEEAYFFQFSKLQGYGLAWQFDDEGELDQAFSLRSNDVLYMSRGYHPTVAGPGSDLYHLTFICGPSRVSKARVHPDYTFLLDEQNLENPYAKQVVKK